MEKPKKVETILIVSELKTLSNLLFTGKWNFSLQESNNVVAPLINKLAKILDETK